MASSTSGRENVVDDNNPMLYAILVYGLILVGGLAAAIYYFFFRKNEEKRKGTDTKTDNDIDYTLATNSVGLEDVTYIASKLRPDSDQLDVLLAVASTPESIAWSTRSLASRKKIVQNRLEEEKKELAKKKPEIVKIHIVCILIVYFMPLI